jgi:hypothetical protein
MKDIQETGDALASTGGERYHLLLGEENPIVDAGPRRGDASRPPAFGL